VNETDSLLVLVFSERRISIAQCPHTTSNAPLKEHPAAIATAGLSPINFSLSPAVIDSTQFPHKCE